MDKPAGENQGRHGPCARYHTSLQMTPRRVASMSTQEPFEYRRSGRKPRRRLQHGCTTGISIRHLKEHGGRPEVRQNSRERRADEPENPPPPAPALTKARELHEDIDRVRPAIEEIGYHGQREQPEPY